MELILGPEVSEGCGRGRGEADVYTFYPLATVPEAATAIPVDNDQIGTCAQMISRVTTNVEAL